MPAGGSNMIIMRSMDVFFAFPSVLLAVAISGSLGGGMVNQLITLTVVLTPPLCRVAETATSQIRNMDFVDAARASGASTVSILLHHVLVNVVSPVLVYASTLVSASILLASGLSFLGLGVSPPTPDWGLMLSTLRAGDLCAADRLRHAGRRDPAHLHRLQSRERRAAAGDGREGVSREGAA